MLSLQVLLIGLWLLIATAASLAAWIHRKYKL